MFNPKSYLAVNREERFYCFLFAHALLSSPSYRERIVALIRDRRGVELDPTALEVFVEVAALRDFWNDLGDPREYNRETHERRLAAIHAIMGMESIDPTIIDKCPVFWTGKPGSKLWYPGRWDVRELEGAGLRQLKRIRWAFNAKPDILLLSPKAGLVIEAKVESGEGRDEEAGYDQIETQKLIISLWKALIPAFERIDAEPATLKLVNSSHNLMWEDVIPGDGEKDVDEFTRRGLAGLRRYRLEEAV